MRITLISDPDLVNTNYRAYQPMHVLSARGHTIHFNDRGAPRFDPRTLMRSDAVLIHRYCDPQIQQVVAQLREAGIGVVWDDDDDVGAVPRSNPVAGYKGLDRHKVLSGVNAMLRAVDLVTTPSETLAEKFRAAGARRVRVMENYVRDDFVVKRERRKDAAVVIGWLAGIEHRLDYEQLKLQPVLERLIGDHPALRVESIGLNLRLPAARYGHSPHITFTSLPAHLSQFDIGVAPLADVPFNRARSNVKLKEYGAAGVAWLASPVGAYRAHGEKQGGQLVADDRWHEHLTRLIVNPREREKLAKRAFKWASKETISRHADLWEQALSEAIEDAWSRPRASRSAAAAGFR